MKTAKKIACAYDLECPHCGETIPSPRGSLFWTVDEIHTGEVVVCIDCGKECKLPKV